MGIRSLSIIFIGLVILSSCASEPLTEVADPLHVPVLSSEKVDIESYKVYAAVLGYHLKGQKAWVSGSTGTGLLSEKYESSQNVDMESVASYNQANISPKELVPGVPFDGINYSLINSSMESTQAQKPLPVITFSRVGFNSTMDRALVSTAYTCGRLCGSGDFFYLVRVADGWKVEWVQGVWIS